MEETKFWNGAKVLVTGGAGFIGSHLVKRLVSLSARVTAADNLSRGKLENLGESIKSINFKRIDLTNLADCMALSKDTDYIFHLASAVGGVQYIFKENVENLTPPSIMNLNILEAARRNEIKSLVFASSACVYRSDGDALNRFKEEEAYPANPPTTYGWAKVLGETACRAYYKDYGLKSTAIRIFNAYGENESLDPKSSHVIPSLIRKAILYPEDDFVVFGDGTQERAFLYVEDLVDAFLLAMRKPTGGEAINVGSKEIVSINDLSRKVIEISGKEIKVRYDLKGPRGVDRYCADLTKAQKLLGWMPTTSLTSGLRRTFEWANQQLILVQ